MSLHNKLCSQHSSHILTQESAARMNDCDNTTGLPATRRQFLLTRQKPGDENILSKLIEKTSQKQGIERYVCRSSCGKMYPRKTNFPSIMYQTIVPWTVSYNMGSLGLTCTWDFFKLSLFCFLTILFWLSIMSYIAKNT